MLSDASMLRKSVTKATPRIDDDDKTFSGRHQHNLPSNQDKQVLHPLIAKQSNYLSGPQ